MRLNKGEDMILAAHSLVECYSTLTRMPPPNRFSPHGASAVIQSDFIARAQAVAGLDSTEILRLLAEAPARGVSGGRTYDLLIAATAERAGADLLLTFNIRHFADLAIVVQEPG